MSSNDNNNTMTEEQARVVLSALETLHFGTDYTTVNQSTEDLVDEALVIMRAMAGEDSNEEDESDANDESESERAESAGVSES